MRAEGLTSTPNESLAHPNPPSNQKLLPFEALSIEHAELGLVRCSAGLPGSIIMPEYYNTPPQPVDLILARLGWTN